ncbi:MAG: hypothetical protein DDG59_14360 [Anaerolineae bacterium]|jgi:uncharacterized protein (TIRG00374 family)|nr:MAG: hypothetical protein DDG59_14360 [Anaerolineae bacterium]
MSRRWVSLWLTLSLFGLAGGLLAWTLARVRWQETWLAFRSLELWELALWASLNLSLVALFSGRWWFLLRLQSLQVPFFPLVLYRLAGFGLSYLTPGPQFGGEGWLVVLLQRRHAVPPMEGSISVVMDKLIELLANFSFLAFGLLVSLHFGLPQTMLSTALTVPLIALLSVPFLLFGLLAGGILPASWLVERASRAPKFWLKLLQVFSDAERRSATLIRRHLWALAAVYLYSLGTWLVMVGEYWLMLHILGFDLNLPQALFSLTAARLAFLTPLPGGLGALEAAQVTALQVLGFSASIGFSLSVMQRVRDLLLATLGIVLGSLFHIRPRPALKPMAGLEAFPPSSLPLQERDP